MAAVGQAARNAARNADRNGRGAATRSTSPKVRGAQRDDYECPVCLELCAQPVLTPCKHMMCIGCQKKIAQAGVPCPMCRAHFDKLFVPQVDQDLQREIAEAMGAQFEERKQELEAAGEWLANKRLVKFTFGNTHEEVKNPAPARSDKTKTNTHRWCMFASLAQGADETGKFIKSVTYHLHPTFRPAVIKVTKAPFLLSRLGWGYFDVKMVVEFQPETGLGTREIVHELSFDENGKSRSFLLEVSANVDDHSLAQALAAEMDKLNTEASK